MRARRRAESGRREPVFDATPTPGMDLRLSPADRPGGYPQDDPEIKPSKPAEPAARRGNGTARSRKAANDDSRGGADKDNSGGRGRARGRKGGGGRKRSGFARLIYWAFVLTLWVAIAGLAVLVWVFAHLPPIQSLEVPKRPPSVQIVGAGGQTLATRGEMGGSAVALNELPKYVPQAFLAIEDRRFYSHFGLDVLGVVRAVVANMTRRGVAQGGSTLTQQLAKNVFLTQERTVERKLQELVLALWLERKFSKAQILELYVNRVYFGAGAYGVEGAAQRYFGKSARALTLSEAALLAGLVKSPSRLAPTRNPQGAQKRAELVVAAMSEAGFITPEMAKIALANPAKVARAAGSNSANYVADWVMDVLDDLVGRWEDDLVVDTTIDLPLQAAAEKALTEELAAKGGKLDVEQGALIAMSPDGAVRALVGGKNYAESPFNRAIAAKRQPGSSFKAFVFLAALERGLAPDTIREDRPINVKGWQPENYTKEYFGPVTLSRALAQSLNTVAVRLTLEVGPKTVVQTAHRLGIASTLSPNASIALGTSEVSVLEMATAFTPFANGGIAVTPHVVARVRTVGGKVLYRGRPEALGRIIEPRAVAGMNIMMRETLVNGTARKAELPGWQAAGKTGTSQDFRDAWFIGYTPHLVTAVWLGNDDNTPMKKITGGGLPVEIWSRFMKAAHQGVPVAELPGLSGRYALPPPGAPPAAVAGRAAPLPASSSEDTGRPVRQQGKTLDQWFLDAVFGRR